MLGETEEYIITSSKLVPEHGLPSMTSANNEAEIPDENENFISVEPVESYYHKDQTLASIDLIPLNQDVEGPKLLSILSIEEPQKHTDKNHHSNSTSEEDTSRRFDSKDIINISTKDKIFIDLFCCYLLGYVACLHYYLNLKVRLKL